MTQGVRSTQSYSLCLYHAFSKTNTLISDAFRYGGPESQQVNVEYKRDWHDYLVCTLQYIVVVVDGRGTGFKGRHLRNPVRNNLGFWETQDQINAARYGMPEIVNRGIEHLAASGPGKSMLTGNVLEFGDG
jgi:hypothetical protein